MKTKLIKRKITYNGSQLRPLYSYENHKILGNSIIAFMGPCDVDLEHMVDYEDKIVKASIRSENMVHFIIETFKENLTSAVLLQRLMASIIQNYIFEQKKIYLIRKGDDLYLKDRKFSISIASISPVSSQIHFAVNITNKNVPVKSCSLEDFKINPEKFAISIMKAVAAEFTSVVQATEKVKPLA